MTLSNFIFYVILPILGFAVVFALIRLVRGPSMPDRVVALDLLSTLGIGILAVYAIATDQVVFLDAATVIALVTFLSTIAFAYYLRRRVD